MFAVQTQHTLTQYHAHQLCHYPNTGDVGFYSNGWCDYFWPKPRVLDFCPPSHNTGPRAMMISQKRLPPGLINTRNESLILSPLISGFSAATGAAGKPHNNGSWHRLIWLLRGMFVLLHWQLIKTIKQRASKSCSRNMYVLQKTLKFAEKHTYYPSALATKPKMPHKPIMLKNSKRYRPLKVFQSREIKCVLDQNQAAINTHAE